jgi:hypothetical protein
MAIIVPLGHPPLIPEPIESFNRPVNYCRVAQVISGLVSIILFAKAFDGDGTDPGTFYYLKLGGGLAVGVVVLCEGIVRELKFKQMALKAHQLASQILMLSARVTFLEQKEEYMTADAVTQTYPETIIFMESV